MRDKVLTHAVLQGYETLLMKGQYPAVVLFLDVPFGEVDVNVHPAKFEVRFRRQSDIHEAVARAIRHALRQEAKEPGLRSGAISSSPFSGVREAALSYGLITRTAQNNLAPAYGEVFVLPPRTKVREGFYSSMRVLGQILGCYWSAPRRKG